MMFLRIASALAAVQGFGHAIAVVRWLPSRGAQETAVVFAMKSESFVFQGLARSYWDFFFGYGLLTAFSCVVEAAVLWQVAALARSGVHGCRAIVVVFLIAVVVHAFLSGRYFFFTPVIFDVAIAVCLMAALRSMA
jgi:hypothetical protein